MAKLESREVVLAREIRVQAQGLEDEAQYVDMIAMEKAELELANRMGQAAELLRQAADLLHKRP